jgi:hypothetical protein
MKEKLFYLIYRIHNEDDEDIAYLFGWTNSKIVAKAFLTQRDPKKYTMYKRGEDDLIAEFSESIPVDELRIDYVKLKSSSTGESILFLTTLSELQEAEKKIQAMFRELCSLDRICKTKDAKDLMYYFSMFMNLRDDYAEALYNIGYRPKEYSMLFDSETDANDMEETIEYSYTEGMYLSEWNRSSRTMLPAQTLMEDISNIVIYSLESFVKVLYQDL